MDTIHQRILAVRKKAALTQEEFALRVNSSRSIISQIEIGKIQPSYEILIALAKEFGTSYTYLLEGTEPAIADQVNEPALGYKQAKTKELERELYFLRKEVQLLQNQVKHLEELAEAYKKLAEK
ncbi:MAG: helix-turn-helix domain-containing protein [Chitinophagales bacterium]|nr:helix-turn-helix domain-containing protein [Chitinophagales bacterium]